MQLDALQGAGCVRVLGALGQFECDPVRECTRAGLTAAAVHARKGGRKPVVTPEILRKARALIAQGLTCERQQHA